MDIIFGIKGNILIAELLGEVDHHSAAKARADIDETMDGYGSKDLIFDFLWVTFMDSSGIGIILGLHFHNIQRGAHGLPPLVGEIMDRHSDLQNAHGEQAEQNHGGNG